MTTATSSASPHATESTASRADRDMMETIAANVTRLRRNSGLDLETLSVASGLGLEQLRAIESARTLPPLRALWALADAFEVPFGVLLSGATTSDTTFRVLRSGDARRVDSGAGFRSRSLSTAGDPREPEIYEITLAPGWREDAAPHAIDTFEHIVVVQGMLELRAGDANAVLRPGDVVFFLADRPHAYRNPATIETVLHLTMTYAGDWSVAAVDFG